MNKKIFNELEILTITYKSNELIEKRRVEERCIL